MKNYYKANLKLVSMLALVVGLLTSNRIYSQSTLQPGDIIFTGYNAVPNPVDNADVISFVLLRDISANTIINFTDRGYFGSGVWQNIVSTEGTIRWTAGSALPLGTEVEITGLTSRARIPGGSLMLNGTVIKTEYSGTTGNNTANTGLLLASAAGDQIIAFQGGTSPSDPGVIFIAGLHFGTCPTGTNDSNWDLPGCTYSTGNSTVPPGLVNGFSAFRAIPPSSNSAYSGRFKCTGAPYSNASAIRAAVMNSANWEFSNDSPGLAQPSGCMFVAQCVAPAVTSQPGNRTICSGASTTFSVTGSGTGLSYQWQVNNGNGYTNISNGGAYSGATTSTLTISNASVGAIYRCIISNECGVVTSTSGTLTVTTLNLSTSKTNVSCNGGSNGTASVTVSGGSGFYSYSWAPSGGTGSTATGLSAGSYTVTVTDSNGCQNSATVTIDQSSALTASTSYTNVSCNGASNGTASVTPSGGGAPYTYSWSHGPITQSVSGLAPGNYSVTITDINGCQIQRDFTIQEPLPLTVSQASFDSACSGSSSGYAAVLASGGVGPYDYSWSHGVSGSIATNLAPGSYTVTITDSNGCQTERTFIINEPSPMIVTKSQTNVSCAGGSNGSATVEVSGGGGAYTYSWAPSGGYGPTATGLSAGTYTVTIWDINTCETSETFVITEPTPLSVEATSITHIGCDGGNLGEITVNATGGGGSYTYSWSPSGGTSATASGLAPGIYTVTVTDSNLCSVSENFEVVGLQAPTIELNETASFCEQGGEITLTPTLTTNFAQTGFTGDFAEANWSSYSSNSNGSINMTTENLVMVSGDNNSNTSGYNDRTITIPYDAVISFNWSYSTVDNPTYDYPLLVLNEEFLDFNGYSYTTFNNQSGNHTISVSAGDVFTIRMFTSDNRFGSATITISNFTVNSFNYEYQWTASEGGVINGDGDQRDLTVNAGGIYTLILTDLNSGCSTEKSVEVSAISVPAPEGDDFQPIPEGETWTLADLTVDGTNLTWYTDEELTTSVPDTTEAEVGATYYVTQTIYGCESNALAIQAGCIAPTFELPEIASFCEQEGEITLTPTLTTNFAQTGFTGDFAEANWSSYSSNSNGSINMTTENLVMVSGDNNSNTSGYNDRTITIPYDAVISFNWSYSTVDNPTYDYPQLVLNGEILDFNGYSYTSFAYQSGNHTISVSAGDVFTIRMFTFDNRFGSATITISNFTVSRFDYEYQWTASEGGVINGDGDQRDLTVNAGGIYTLILTDLNSGCSTEKSVEVNSVVVAPPVGTTNPVVDTLITSFADLNITGTNLKWYADEALTSELSSSGSPVSETTYYVTQTVGECESAPLAVTVYDVSLAGNCQSFSIWNGTSWSHGEPDYDTRIIIKEDLTIASEFYACEVLVESGTLTVTSGTRFDVWGQIHNMQQAENFVLESGASLKQSLSFANNIGPIRVKRDVTIKHLDYTIWSSPVSGQNLQAFSPYTLPNRIYSYNASAEVNDWVVASGNFETGKGYMFRAPNVFDDGYYPNEYTWTGTFEGVPNNGTMNIPMEPIGKYQAVGNPYPSNIRRDIFHAINYDYGALYFWTNTFPQNGNGSYTGNNWKVVNTLGESVAAGTNVYEPVNYMAVGQGFLARTYNNVGSIIFTNAMRIHQSAPFYNRSEDEIENHKYWLSLSKENNGLNQILVSYNSLSTNELDFGIDAETAPYDGSSIYSLIQNSNENFAIQGRALPFDITDVVPLGLKISQTGSYTISLDNVEGLFADGQNIYLRDKLTQVVHNLKEGNYSFVSEAGIFNDRFEIIYTTEALGVNHPILENSWLVYKNGNDFQILSKGFQMKDVVVYDMLGRVVYSAKDINSDNHLFTQVGANQVLIVKVITTDNTELTKKVVN